MKKYILYNKPLLAAVILSRIAQTTIVMYFSVLVRDVINMATTTPSLKEVIRQVLFAGVYCFAQAVSQQLAGNLTVRYCNQSIYLLRNEFFENILTRPYSEVVKKPSAHYISNLTNDINIIATDYVGALFSAINSIIAIVVVLVYGFYLSPEITGIMISLTVFLVIPPLLFTRSIDRRNYMLSEANDRYMANVKDVLSGYSSVIVDSVTITVRITLL